MAKALKTAALVVAGVALVATGVGAIALPAFAGVVTVAGISTTTMFLVSAGLSVAAAVLQKKPGVTSSQTDRLTANIDPRAFRKTVFGQTAMPVDVRYEEWSGSGQEYCDWIVALASHAIDGVEEIWLNSEMAWSATTGVVGKYVGYFSIPNIVLEGTPANAFTFGSGAWNAATARLTGCAYARLRFKVTGNSKKAESPFASGIPSRITIIGRGAKLYDPRRDSSVPGGSGPMRADDQSTWRYTTDDGQVIGENLPLQILRTVLGWRIRNPLTGEMRLATGSGVPARRIGMPSFQVAANLADELVNRAAGGNEPRYHGAGVVSEGDDPKSVLDMQCAGCNARFRDTGGKLSIAIAHNDLASAATDDGLTDDDLVGGFSWDPDPALEATPNVVRGRYVDASTNSLYQLIDYPEVRVASADGQDRILPLDLGVVESASQAQRIAAQVLQRRQFLREFSAPFDIRAWKYGVGDLVPLTLAALGFVRMLFRVKEQELGQNGVCNMVLSYETALFYQWDADDRPAVQAAPAIVYDSTNNPLIRAIADVEGVAEAASLRIARITSDDWLSANEKPAERIAFQALSDDWSVLREKAMSLEAADAAIGTARVAADNAIYTLSGYLNGLAPSWIDTSSDTPIVAADYRDIWGFAYSRVAELRAIITGRPGADGTSPPLIRLDASALTLRVGTDGNYVGGQQFDFRVVRINLPGSPRFELLNSSGAIVLSGTAYELAGDAYSWTTTASDNLTLTPAGAAYMMNVHGGSVGRIALRTYVPGSAVTDTVSIQTVRDGARGIDGAPGARGDDGRTQYTHYAYANSPNGTVDFAVGAPAGRAYVGTYVDFTAADSANAASYTWTAYKGPAAFGLAARGDVVVASNALVKTGSETWGSGGGYSTEGWKGGAQASFKLASPSTFAGLNTDPTTDDAYASIDYAFHCSADGNTYIFESGSAVVTLTGGNVFARTFQIVYDNAFVRYYVDGALIRETPAPAGLTLYFDASIATAPGYKITDINFLAAGTAGAAAIDVSLAASLAAAPFNAANAYTGGEVVFTATRKNTAETPVFTIKTSDGTTHGNGARTAAQHAADYPNAFGTTGVDVLIVKPAQIVSMLSGSFGTSFNVAVTASTGRGQASVARVTDGAAGAPGAPGAPGQNAGAVSVRGAKTDILNAFANGGQTVFISAETAVSVFRQASGNVTIEVYVRARGASSWTGPILVNSAYAEFNQPAECSIEGTWSPTTPGAYEFMASGGLGGSDLVANSFTITVQS